MGDSAALGAVLVVGGAAYIGSRMYRLLVLFLTLIRSEHQVSNYCARNRQIGDRFWLDWFKKNENLKWISKRPVVVEDAPFGKISSDIA